MQINGFTIVQSVYVSDQATTKRSIIERLFTLPWQPLRSTKTVYSPRAYVYSSSHGRQMWVSPNTYQALRTGHITMDKVFEKNPSFTTQPVLPLPSIK